MKTDDFNNSLYNQIVQIIEDAGEITECISFESIDNCIQMHSSILWKYFYDLLSEKIKEEMEKK